ncbi:MAG: nuclease A inhibitor family protein [Acidobacteria bacterium]|nr:nuclease A inhibitor family protein [Acidobacteriota bacterium]
MRSDEQIVEDLERATAGLFIMSESDYPFQVIRWEGLNEITPQFLREVTGQNDDAPVTVQSVAGFFGNRMAVQKLTGERDRVELKGYEALLRILNDNLDDLKVYRIGEINIPVFILGRSKTGNWLGLSTRVVET